jgi:tRNA1(Val) A37 N6-methylase TrmN6
MNDCCSFIADGSAEDIDTTFSRSIIANDLKRYHKYGPRKSSRILSSLIEQHRSQQDVSLCDVGSGIGSIAHAFLNGNSTAVTVVETSSAYIKASEEEAQKRGTHDRITYHHGDYVHLAYEIGSHDLMCLDRVLCCYPNMDSLVGLSAINTARYRNSKRHGFSPNTDRDSSYHSQSMEPTQAKCPSPSFLYAPVE